MLSRRTLFARLTAVAFAPLAKWLPNKVRHPSVEVFTNEDLPPDAGDPMPMNSSGGDIVRLGDVPVGESVVFTHVGGKLNGQEEA